MVADIIILVLMCVGLRGKFHKRPSSYYTWSTAIGNRVYWLHIWSGIDTQPSGIEYIPGQQLYSYDAGDWY